MEPDVLCNLCGLSCVLGHQDHDLRRPHGLINQTVRGGYHSTPGNGLGALDDTMSYKFSLCEFCLDWLFSQFKTPVELGCYMGGLEEGEVWKPAAQRVEEDDWRAMKEEFRAELEKRNAARSRHG